jgi:hypothetical protein
MRKSKYTDEQIIGFIKLELPRFNGQFYVLSSAC